MTGVLTWARLSYRQQRWELILVLVGVAATTAAMLWFAGTLDGMRAASPECLASLGNLFSEGPGPQATCQAVITAYNDNYNWGTNLVNLAWAAPFGIGVILGAPLVAREIDGGTAQLAWSLGRSRVGWLLRRIAFVSLFGLALLAVLAVSSELLTAAMFPEQTLSEDFIYFGRRGLPVVARGVGAIMLGVLVGALIGRVLPAILAAALVIGLVFMGLSLAEDRWNRAEATMQRFTVTPSGELSDMAALAVDYGMETADGEFITYGEASARGMNPNFADEDGGWYASEEDLEAGRLLGYDARLSIPGQRYPDLILRHSALAAALGILALGLTGIVVVRRRPA
ncbi:MAG TPA: hypothetical protein VEW95_01935 [Candidatus Limnocylindrales bacterium]|nr:hypothetical protein [Candidatus Limnocylindrales bacterium]